MPRPISRQTALLATLTTAVAVLAVAGVRLGLSTWLEAASVVTGAVCVWLTVRESVWNFPISLANVSLFCVLFFQSRLFADAGLQAVYFVLSLIGWRLWLHGGERGTALRISRIRPRHAGVMVACGIVLTLVLWMTLRYAGGSASFFDALTTSLSLCAQWMLNRKHVESWYAWIAADLVYVPLYAYKELYLTAGLYAVFLVMAAMGLMQWRATWRAQDGGTAHPAPGPVGAAA
ncbi:nicotinamide riboside transporter PnuC [Longimicrobium sp.]|uniref:nicotinamide riboside transporter PnuC n=1 Tax=Longimicrobium sp. TaxID=2029185 RepID=UPI002E37C6BB|nr:nicotinamide riboside transporter PnuC [Longimicrobium sp.]HEX6042109.1 nicotinamide riboside transporter PnuC [Longimicrobium sp.]